MHQKERTSSFYDFSKKNGLLIKEKDNNLSNYILPSEKDQIEFGENFNLLNFSNIIDSKNFKSEKKYYKPSNISM